MKVWTLLIGPFQVTLMHIVPPIVLYLKDTEAAKECDKSKVRLIVSAAAPLAPETQEEFYSYMKKSNPFIQIIQGVF